MSEFAIWDGTYEKDPYLALIGGKRVPCWANAGYMDATDGSGRSWKPEDNIQVRLCTWEEYFAAMDSDTSSYKREFRIEPARVDHRDVIRKPKHSEGGIMAKAQWAKKRSKWTRK